MNIKKILCVIALFIHPIVFLSGAASLQAENNNSVYDYFQNGEQQKGDHQNKKENLEQGKVVNDKAESGSDGQKVGVSFMDIVRTLFVLLFVIGLLLIVLKWLQKKNNLSSMNQLVTNLGGTSLGGNRSVQLIKTGRSILIVGVGDDVHLLKEINDEKEIEAILEEYNKRLDQQIHHRDFIPGIVKWKNHNKNTDKIITFKTELTKQLNEMKKTRREVISGNTKRRDLNKNE